MCRERFHLNCKNPLAKGSDVPGGVASAEGRTVGGALIIAPCWRPDVILMVRPRGVSQLPPHPVDAQMRDKKDDDVLRKRTRCSEQHLRPRIHSGKWKGIG